MNNKYAFFLLCDISTLLFTAVEAFSGFVSISHSLTKPGTDRCSLFLDLKLFGG